MLTITLLSLSACDNIACIDRDLKGSAGPCTPAYNPVCGCDNITYTNSCYAENNGLVSWIGGPCP